MHPEEGPVSAVAARLRERFGDAPATAIVLGSGLGVVENNTIEEGGIGTTELGLPRSTVAGHAGQLYVGRLGGARIVTLSGRVHLYEGYSAGEVVRYVRAFHRWGVQNLVLTCSAGGISEGMDTGRIVRLVDHINLQRANPLEGPLWAEPRFPDLTVPYDPHLGAVIDAVAEEHGTPLGHGVYAAVMGPSYETPAEIRALGLLGADLVGMSTVPEVIAARHLGMRVAAVAVVANRAAGLAAAPLTHEEVTRAAGEAGARVAELLEVAVGRF